MTTNEMNYQLSVDPEREKDQNEVLKRQGYVVRPSTEPDSPIQIPTQSVPFDGHQQAVPIGMEYGFSTWNQYYSVPQNHVLPQERAFLETHALGHSSACAKSQENLSSSYPPQSTRPPTLHSTSQSTSHNTAESTPKTKSLSHSQSPAASTSGRKCTHCGRIIMTDFARHLRIHEPARFHCLYPREFCPHKTGSFNRLYDFKKHLLHCHFKLSNSRAIRINKLSDKLDSMGQCPCGRVMSARDYLENHAMMKDEMGQFKCLDLKERWEEASAHRSSN